MVSCLPSLAWGHADGSIVATLLVAAALSDGNIVLICAGPVTGRR